MVNVLLIYTELIPSVRFCALEPLRLLEKENKIKLVHKKSHDTTARELNDCDVLVLVRCSEDCEAKIAKKCKEAGRRLVYVLDDDLLNVPEEIECHAYYASEGVRSNIKNIMALCDVLWTPNQNLIKKYGSLFRKCVLIDEPFIGSIYTGKTENEDVRIGFAGSVTHKAFVNDFMRDVLKKIKKLHGKRISIEFFGFKPDFTEEIGAKYIPYSDNYEAYCRTMRERNWDIGLAPLEESEFSSCKYFNKYIEYSSYGIAGIYSAVEPYTFGIKNNVNGILAENTTEAWVSALDCLIKNKELVSRISACAQNELCERFTVKAVAETIFEGTDFVCCDKAGNKIRYRKESFIFSKIKIYTQIYGIKMPFVVIKKATRKLLNLFAEQ